MHLKTIEIQDFQSIKHVKLELGKYTVLVGPSDAGKSAFIRGILSVFTNPAGQAKIRKGSNKSVVALEFDEGTEVKYAKSKTSAYEITFPDKKGQCLDKMGREVPSEIQEMVTPWQVGDDTILVQFQKQIGMDQYFILSPSGGRAGMMRALDDLDAKPYRKALTECQSSVRAMRRDLNEIRKREDEWKEKQEKLAGVEDLVKEVEIATRKVNVLEKLGKLWILSRLPDLKHISVIMKYGVLRDYEAPTVEFGALGVLLKLSELNLELVDVVAEHKEVKAKLIDTDATLFEEGVCPLCKQPMKK